VKVPFGIAQIGKSFRNEINPRNYTFRSREFEQMEIEFFCHDDTRWSGTSSGANVRYQLVRQPRPAEREAAPARPGRRRAGPLLPGLRRHRVPLPVLRGLPGARGRRPPRLLRPDPAPDAQRQGPDLLRRRRLGARQGAARRQEKDGKGRSRTSRRTASCPTSSSPRREPTGRRWRSSARPTPRTSSPTRRARCRRAR
jgi:hypothetical protein